MFLLDNPSFHRSVELAGLVQKYKAKLLFCPAYSPFVNPVEFANRYPKRQLKEMSLHEK